MKILNFLYDCGKISTPERHEFILLSDVIGFSALVDMINTRGGGPKGRTSGRSISTMRPKRRSATISPKSRGRVGPRPRQGARHPAQSAAGRHRRHLAGRRNRHLSDPGTGAGQDKYDLRGKFTADDQGRYYYTTVLPKPYTVPYDGPVGRLLRAGNRHAWRAAHLHYIVRAQGMRSITTEVFFEAPTISTTTRSSACAGRSSPS
jgi:hydroxyquinol 1,2-dioxygenase